MRNLFIVFTAFLGGCATMLTAGDNRGYPVQVYSGTQLFLAEGPRRQDEPEFRSAYFNVFVLGTVVTVVTDTLVLPVTVPLTVINVFVPPDQRVNFALEHH